MTRKQRRLSFIGLGFVVLAAAASLILVALQDSIVFFQSPSDIVARPPAPGQRLRLGGLVLADSVERQAGDIVHFTISDGGAERRVTYVGILPDLFREGQGVVTEGSLRADGIFHAQTVLAKHDESYMPREVADALKRQGVWQGGAPLDKVETKKLVPVENSRSRKPGS